MEWLHGCCHVLLPCAWWCVSFFSSSVCFFPHGFPIFFSFFIWFSLFFYHLVHGASTILNRSVGRVRHWGVPTSAQAAGSMVRKDVFVNEPHPPQIRLAVWWEYSMGVDGHPPLRWQSSHCPLILDTHLAPTMWTKIDWTMASGFWCFFRGMGSKYGFEEWLTV